MKHKENYFYETTSYAKEYSLKQLINEKNNILNEFKMIPTVRFRTNLKGLISADFAVWAINNSRGNLFSYINFQPLSKTEPLNHGSVKILIPSHSKTTEA